MVALKTLFSFRGVGTLFLLIMTFANVIMPMVSGGIDVAQGEGWGNFLRATAGKLMSTDREIGILETKLEQVQANPDNFDAIDTDNLKSRLLTTIAMLLFIIYLIFSGVKKIYLHGKPEENRLGFMGLTIVLLLTMVVVISLHSAWMVIEKNQTGDGTFDVNFPEDLPMYNFFRFNWITLADVTGGKDIFEEIRIPDNITEDDIKFPDTITIINT